VSGEPKGTRNRGLNGKKNVNGFFYGRGDHGQGWLTGRTFQTGLERVWGNCCWGVDASRVRGTSRCSPVGKFLGREQDGAKASQKGEGVIFGGPGCSKGRTAREKSQKGVGVRPVDWERGVHVYR